MTTEKQNLIARIAELETAMYNVLTAYNECEHSEGNVLIHDEDVVDAFATNYPFQRSFDEECSEVASWASDVKEALEKS